MGQQEYLQGYLPVRMLAEHLINGTPLVEAWIETPTEVVTAENVDDYVSRQTDNQVQYDYYQEYLAENYADLEAVARPYDDLRHRECLARLRSRNRECPAGEASGRDLLARASP